MTLITLLKNQLSLAGSNWSPPDRFVQTLLVALSYIKQARYI